MASRETWQNLAPTESPWPHRLAWALAMVVFPLIWMGGTVTTYEAGMAVPDWPTTYSFWFYPVQLWLAVWDVFLEHGHRLLGQVAGILAILLAVAIWRRDDRKWMRWVGAAIVVGVIAQGVLGGLRVLADDRLLARVHGCTAALYFALCAAVVTWTSRAWRCGEGGKTRGEGREERGEGRGAIAAPPSPALDAPPSPPAPLPKGEGRVFLPRLGWFVTGAIYLEIILGAELRRPSANTAFGGSDWFEFWVWLKIINAGLIALGVACLVIGVLRRAGNDSMLVRRARWLAAIVSLQLLLAAATWVTNYGWPAWFTAWVWPLQSAVLAQGRLLVLATTAHAAVGSLTLAVSVNLALWLSKTSSMQLTLREHRSRLRVGIAAMDYWRLIRPRIVALVLLAMAVSAWTTAASPPSWRHVAHALAGTALVITGAIALNQRMECQGDAKMRAHRERPLPAGRLSRRQVTLFGLGTTAVGMAYLTLVADPLLTVLAAVGWAVYVVAYTPLKTRSAWQTPVGAVAGATPVLLGAAAVGGSLYPWAFVLFGIVYCWQFPHSMAVAWRYRREFAAAGVKVAAVTDPTGQTAGRLAVLGATVLLPASLLPLPLGLAGAAYGAAALAMGAIYLATSVWFARRPDDETARRLLVVSLIYLPAMLAAILSV